MVGTGANLPRWKAQADADGLAGRIRFLGYRTDVPDILAGCDALAHPARYEPYGMAVQEAVCRGLPVFVSSAAGVSELISPGTCRPGPAGPGGRGRVGRPAAGLAAGPGSLAGPGR